VGIFLAGGALVMSYLLAALVPSFNRTMYNYVTTFGGPPRMVPVPQTGVHPTEGLIAAMMMMAGALWMGSILWLFFRGARPRPLARPILLTLAIVVLTIGAGIMADSTLRGDQELVITGLSLVGAAAVLIVWVQAVRQMAVGRPLRDRQDKLLDVRCPECGYRMVGLHESRCPECGRMYTLDELLARQNFAKPQAAPAVPVAPAEVPVSRPASVPVPPPPPIPHSAGVVGQAT
jgi:DNA-directed RNA polymerase subunit RPC12/RpoP